MKSAQEIAKEVIKSTINRGEALYLIGDDVVCGKDGCQPANSLCLAVDSVDDLTVGEIVDAIDLYRAAR